MNTLSFEWTPSEDSIVRVGWIKDNPTYVESNYLYTLIQDKLRPVNVIGSPDKVPFFVDVNRKPNHKLRSPKKTEVMELGGGYVVGDVIYVINENDKKYNIYLVTDVKGKRPPRTIEWVFYYRLKSIPSGNESSFVFSKNTCCRYPISIIGNVVDDCKIELTTKINEIIDENEKSQIEINSFIL